MARNRHGAAVTDRGTGAPPDGRPGSLDEHARESLRYIRRTMESAGSFTAVSGAGQIAMGLTATAAAVAASQQERSAAWLGVWLAEAALAAAIGTAAIARKAWRTQVSLGAGPARRAALGFAPAVLAGLVLTPALHAWGLTFRLPGVWLLLFGAGVVTGGVLSVVRIIPIMGAVLMALGAAALLAPEAWGDVFMAAGFGAVMAGFGVAIARKHGG